ncbi:MAG TPA: Fic family protein [Steroidobacter sp.]|uniref:Fic family protein n=1 Tax=Steroidobacter sp. TaxID=1978227 RepID=UPI002EDAEC79
MRKSDLHPSLRDSAVPVPGHSGCYAVVPPPVPTTLPVSPPLLPLAQREVQILSDAVEAAPDYAHLLMHMLNRREAVDSSQIEGTHTQFDELLLHEIEKGTPDAVSDSDAEQTLNYVRAYTLGVAQVRKHGQRALDGALICEMHRHLMSGNPRASPGQLRGVQNFIGGLKMEQARFIPPPPEEVPRLMTDLDRLIRHQPDPESHYDVSVLPRAAIVHAQFETIHPFVDGNGRIGRLLFPLMLLADGGHPIHLATFLKCRQREYYDALLDVQMKLHWSPWVDLFLECAIASCRHTVHLLRELRSVAERWQERLKTRGTRKHATVWSVVHLLLGQPVVTVSSLVERLNVTFPSANAAVATLVDLDILRPQGQQRRNRAFHAHEIMNLLYTGIDAVLDDVATLRNYRTGSWM